MGRKPTGYCRMCGAVAPEQGRFCASCGASLNLTSPFPLPPAATLTTAAGSSAIATPPAVLTPSVGGSVRMGFGIACGMLLFFVLLAVVAMIGVGLATSAITWPFAQQGQRFEGTGPADSAPLALNGEYLVEWTAKPTSPSACRLQATLLSTAGAGTSIDLANSMIEARPEPVASNRTVTVDPAPYVIHVESDCTWSIRLIHR